MGIISKLILISTVSLAAFMLSPQTGEEFREDLKKNFKKWKPKLLELWARIDDLWESAKEVDSNKMKINIEKHLEELKKEISTLDIDKASSWVTNGAKKARVQFEKVVKSTTDNPTVRKAAKELVLEIGSFAAATQDLIDSIKKDKKKTTKKTHKGKNE